MAYASGARKKALAGCSKSPSSKAATSEEARRTLRYVEPLSEARTMLAGFFSILLILRCSPLPTSGMLFDGITWNYEVNI
jgi:hypothetical protein